MGVELSENEEIKAVYSDDSFQAILIGDESDLQDITISCSEETVEMVNSGIALCGLEDNEQTYSVSRSVVLSSTTYETADDITSNDYAEAYATLTYSIVEEGSGLLGDLRKVKSYTGGWTKLDSSATISDKSASWKFVSRSTVTAKVSGNTFTASGSALPNRNDIKATSKAKVTCGGKTYTLISTITVS